MQNGKQLQKVNTNVLDSINSAYISDVKEIEEYYPEHIRKKFEKLDDKAKAEIVKTGRRMTSGIKSSIPMICKGSECCLKSICALFDNQVAPVNYRCPYEEFMVDKLTAEYYATLEVDPFNRVERDLIKQMVELIIIDNRSSADISSEGLYTKQTIGIDNKGRTIENVTESIALGIKMKTQARIEKLQNELLATRKIRKQLDVGKGEDPSSKASDLYERFKDFSDKNKIITDAVIEDNNESKSDTSK